ncbi:MAG: helix-turn-helix domain-containing protein [Prevotella sp.]|nr:helix-turn-helix domain-containing protein [Prevotella sp.]MDY4942816.1 helix-turn-helix domain-containing protein [Candidatus Limisoma sp.]MDY5901017.1 helix-turn-helix domain-containing protein [Candidatus Limisoma sp.]
MKKENNIIGETLFPDCPVRNILSRVGDKWSLLLMHHIMHHPEPMRFSDLRKAIPDISQKVLTSTLRNLEADGFIVRRVYAEVPPHTDYALTPRAHSFMNACRPMLQWAIDNFAAIMNDRNRKQQY